MKILFYKYHGAGNDFILIDNVSAKYNLSTEQIAHLCHRRFGIGADGLMLLEHAPSPYGFSMKFYNSDGLAGSMCGNGGRCICAFAHFLGIDNLHFIAPDGPHSGHIVSQEGTKNIVCLQMKDVETVRLCAEGGYFVHTGSPHLVRFVEDVDQIDVNKEGLYWRSHPSFQPEGTNVNFVQIVDQEHLRIRTFERGVEDETWACGTGATASACAVKRHLNSPLNQWKIEARGGDLQVNYTESEGRYLNVFLTGPTKLVFVGEAEI